MTPTTKRIKQLEAKLQAREPVRIMSKSELDTVLSKLSQSDIDAIPDEQPTGCLLSGRHLRAVLDTTLMMHNEVKP